MDYHCPAQLDNSIHHRISSLLGEARPVGDRRAKAKGRDDKSRRSISSAAPLMREESIGPMSSAVARYD